MSIELLTKHFGDFNTAVTEKLDEANGRLSELEKRAAREPANDNEPGGQTWGQQFVAGVKLNDFRENLTRRKQSEGLLMKTTLTMGPTSAGALATNYHDTTVSLPKRRLAIRDLLNTVRIDSNLVEYPSMVGRPTAAAMAAEGTVKAESAMSFELKSTPTQVIAHWIPASRQILEDVPQLTDIIDGELVYGLQFKEEQQILLGDGTAPNLAGLVPAATAYAAPVTIAGATLIDQLGLALLQVSLADFQPDGIVLHPSDWLRMKLMKDAGGNYILGDPAGSIGATKLWGFDVVESQSIGVGKFLTGSFRSAATLYDRWLPRVEVSTEHSDFFVRNMVAILAEERLALAVKQPKALVYGTLV